jgi:hypothetical protein
MDIDLMWNSYTKYKPMLDEAYTKWCESKSPVNVDVPMIDGDAEIGATLTCTMGNWEKMDVDPVSYAYQWLSDEDEVGTGAAGYVIADSDAGASITCVVTATNQYGSTAAPPSNVIAVPAGTGAAGLAAARAHHAASPPVQRPS